jgi:hypothetical protein
MKLIESHNETVILELKREELKDLHSALWPAIVALQREPGILKDLIQECDGIDDPDEITGLIYNAGREEETVEELKAALKRAEMLLPKVYDLSESLVRIMSQKEVTSQPIMENNPHEFDEKELFGIYQIVQKPGMTAQEVAHEIKRQHPHWLQANSFDEISVRPTKTNCSRLVSRA